MAFFVPAEQRERSAQFERYLNCADEVLRNPTVREYLGGVSVDRLINIYQTAFLPNMKHGVLTAPRREAKSSRLAILPVSDAEADNVFESTHPFLDAYYPVSTPMEESFSSSTYGIVMSTQQVRSELFSGVPLQGAGNQPSVNGLRSGTTARTTMNFNLGKDHKGIESFLQSRPLQIVRSAILTRPDYAVGAIAAHEGVHVDDILNDGPMYGTLLYGACSELHGYFVSSAVNYIYGNNDPSLHAVERARKWFPHDIRQPFVPSRQLMDWMIENGSL